MNLVATQLLFVLLVESTTSFLHNSVCHNREMSRKLKLPPIKMSHSQSSQSNKPSVAIIGGGIAGLSCAQHLQTKYDATVFDTGRLRPGGRCSSRYPQDKPKNRKGNQDSILARYTVDHAAQILIVPRGDSFKNFRRQVDIWEEAGLLKRFARDSVVEVSQGRGPNLKGKPNSRADNNPSEASSAKPVIRSINSKHMYYCTQGMGSIPLSMLKSNNIRVEQDVWISPNNGVKYVGTETNPQWSVQTNGKRFGTYDHVVIAHNGKCADRLMSRTPAKDLHSLLRVDFRPYVPNWGGKKMTLNSIYSLTVALKKGDDDDAVSDFVGEKVVTAFVKNEPNLRLITNQSRKFGHDGKSDGDVEVWTILSSPKFAKKYKGPQENLPKERVDEVTALLLSSLERSLGMKEGTIHDGIVKDSRLQLWGAAVPLNVWSPTGESIDQTNSGFLYDAENGVGACGDWLLDPSIAGAWESGRRLANWMSTVEGGSGGKANSVGLPQSGGDFIMSRAASGSGIGNVK